MLLTPRHQEFLVPTLEIKDRIQILQTNLQNIDVSAVWIDTISDLFYLTGSIQKAVLIVPVEGQPLYLVKKSLSRAERESPLEVEPYPGRKGLLKRLQALMGSGKKLGMGMDVTPASTFLMLTRFLEGCEIIDMSLPIRLQRAVKSSWEQQQIRQAASQADIIFSGIQDHIAVGMTELEVSASIEQKMRQMGHAGTLRVRGPGSDLGILNVVSGEAGLYPTNFDGPAGGEGPYPSSPSGAGWKKIQKDETVFVDMVTSYNGYFADNTRTFFTGSQLPDEAKKAHDFCLEVLAMLEQRLRSGRICIEIFQEVQSWVENNHPPQGFMGAGENRVKFFGHGIGVELDEFPVIAGKMDIELKPGMAVAMEPKAFLKSVGPVGAENTYFVTENDCERLCHASMEIGLLE